MYVQFDNVFFVVLCVFVLCQRFFWLCLCLFLLTDLNECICPDIGLITGGNGLLLFVLPLYVLILLLLLLLYFDDSILHANSLQLSLYSVYREVVK